MRMLTMTLVTISCVPLSFWATIAYGQSALPDFSNPYGGSAALVHADAAASGAQKSHGITSSASRSATKHIAHRLSTHKIARKRHVTASRLAAPDLAMPTTALTPPVMSRDTAMPQSKNTDSALDFGLTWSAANDPHFSTSTSTVPAIDEIKRNTNETPAETGSTLEGGVKLRF